MKKYFFLMFVFVFAFSGTVFAVHESSDVPIPVAAGANAALTYYPKFVSRRGFEVGNGSVQATASMIYGPFSINAWSTYNMDNWRAKKADVQVNNKHSITETDWWVTYTKSFDKLSATVGYFYEGYDTGMPSPENTYELFLVLHYNTLLQPGVEVYWDPDKGDGGQFYFVHFGHTFALPHEMSLNVKAWANYNNDNPLYGKFSNFYNGQVDASLAIPITKEISIVPKIGYSFPLSDEAEDALSGFNKSGKADHLYGAITLSAAFGR